MPSDVCMCVISDQQEDRRLAFQLFSELEHVAALRSIDVRLVEMQFNARQQQYKDQFPDAQAWAVRFEGDVVGRMLIDQSKRPWTLVDLTVMASHRGKGIGGQAIAIVLADADAKDESINASLFAQNQVAQRFWERMGFSVHRGDGGYWALRYPAESE
ncbi:GNAT family N-acetyltransferase [Rhodopirellula sp. MGV]|uniref:GNAT family N-acetyltransferase n=1 Tax=Rhodopirellula sp. MGV TaxID=2023130 RepID=UPI000B9682FB|nr:GNAT family N-acetyltransferase [Rhodopirellula sp. MGV]OYP36009.1 hypothetical protein CGZ80_09645 [Rhodopirellula sp. MGV]PNY36633.1 N-acetyltransferase [Rhodopirellula baltica]